MSRHNRLKRVRAERNAAKVRDLMIAAGERIALQASKQSLPRRSADAASLTLNGVKLVFGRLGKCPRPQVPIPKSKWGRRHFERNERLRDIILAPYDQVRVENDNLPLPQRLRGACGMVKDALKIAFWPWWKLREAKGNAAKT